MHNPTLTSDERILAARKALTGRFAALEDRVTSTVERAASTVDQTTSEVRSTVNDASDGVRELIQNTQESLREFFDVRRKVREHPVEGVLLAVGAGFAARLLSSRSSFPAVQSAMDNGLASPLGDLFARVRSEIKTLGETAVATASKKLRENIENLQLPTSHDIYHRNGVH